jgi:DNA invertase Pin-like site-specific DNA recombinase
MPKAYSYIRFSSERQQLGDSLRRQLKLATDYAEKHNLVLDHSTYRDLGVSAYKGKNFIEGKLGTFLTALDEGRVPSDSYLLIESLDRLSRAQVDEALVLFLSIIRRGITIVTLMDGQVYSQARIKQDNGMSIIISLTYMMRAHEESATKSARVKAAWDQSRKDWRPGNTLISRRGPAWLKASADGKSWVEIPEKVNVIKRIYQMAYDEMGQQRITKVLNDEKVPTMEDAAHWTQGVVGAILRNPSVMGQFSQKRGGVQVIDDYFPPVIQKDRWHAVQDGIAKRHRKGSSRGELVSNLFSGMSYCFYCGSRTRFVPTYRGTAYVHCLNAYSNGGCTARQFPYRAAEKAILERLIKKQARDLRGNLFAEAPDESAVLRGSIERLEKQKLNLIALAKVSGGVDEIGKEINKIHLELLDLNKQLSGSSHVPITEAEILESEQLFQHHEELVESKSPELNDLRRRMQGALRRQLQKVEFAPEFMSSGWLTVDIKEPDDLWKDPRYSEFRSKGYLSKNPDFLIQLTYAGGSVRQVEAEINAISKGRRAAAKRIRDAKASA